MLVRTTGTPVLRIDRITHICIDKTRKAIAMTVTSTDEQTYILPAPAMTRGESTILWYEVVASGDKSTCSVVARSAANDDPVESSESAVGADGAVHTVYRSGSQAIEVSVTFPPITAGSMDPRLTINGISLDYAALVSMPLETMSASGLSLTLAALGILQRFARISESLQTLGEVNMVMSAVDDWGCGSCVIAGAGVALGAGACAAAVESVVLSLGVTAPAAGGICAAELGAAGAFVAHCQGACA